MMDTNVSDDVSVPLASTPPGGGHVLQPPIPARTSTHAERDENITNMWHEITGKILGPMPANVFLDTFLPPAVAPAPAFDKEALHEMMDAKTEILMYEPFVSYSSHCCSFSSLNLVVDPYF
jgi:hypothetical protein